MRIVIGSESFYPSISGVSVSTFLLARSLSSAGHQVWLFAPSTDFRDREECPADLPGVRVCRFRAIPNPFRRAFRLSVSPRRLVRGLLRQIQPDLVHLQDPASICAAMLSGAEELNVPAVASHHFSLDYILVYLWFLGPAKHLAGRSLARHLRRFYDRTSAVIAPSQTTAAMLSRWGIRTKVSAISNGVPVERFYSYSPPTVTLRQYHLPGHIPIVLHVGRIDKDKSVECLIAAIPRVLASERAHFVIVGGGDSLGRCQRQARSLGVSESVTFTGPIPHESEDLPRLYQIASVFVIPSAIEAQSIVTLEAMASGLPIVAADAGALAELVTPNENGLLFKPGDPQSLADSVVRLLARPVEAAEFGQRSLLKAGMHRLETVHSHVLNVYQDVLAGRAG